MTHLTKKWTFKFWPQKSPVRRGLECITFYSTYNKERPGLRIAALARLKGTLSAKSHFVHFRVTDLTSEVNGWSRIFNSGINGFGSWPAARWFWIAALARLEGTLSAKSHFGHFRVTDLTSEVNGWSRTLNLGISGFVYWQEACWFFNRSSNSIRSQTRSESSHPPQFGQK